MNVVCGCGRKYRYDHGKGHCKTKCNSCMVNGRRERVKRRCIEYKGGRCILCGYSKCPRAMEFHHVDPKTKKFEVNASQFARSWEVLQKELDKCVLLCSNCHAEVEDGVATLSPGSSAVRAVG